MKQHIKITHDYISKLPSKKEESPDLHSRQFSKGGPHPLNLRYMNNPNVDKLNSLPLSDEIRTKITLSPTLGNHERWCRCQ